MSTRNHDSELAKYGYIFVMAYTQAAYANTI